MGGWGALSDAAFMSDFAAPTVHSHPRRRTIRTVCAIEMFHTEADTRAARAGIRDAATPQGTTRFLNHLYGVDLRLDDKSSQKRESVGMFRHVRIQLSCSNDW